MNKSIKKQYNSKIFQKKRSMKGNGSHKIRLDKESKKYNTNEFVLINYASTHEQNGKMIISAVLMFPSDSIYHEGKFNIQIIVSKKYPFVAPEITITTPMYHPCVDVNGRISYRKLDFEWSPEYTLYSILTEIQNALNKFDTENLYVYQHDINELFNKNRSEFDKIAREYVQQHALSQS